MTWFKLEDGFPEHRKIAQAGGDAGWLFVCGLAHCARNLTDGLIPAGAVPRLSDRKQPMKLARILVDVGLWHAHQTSRAKVEGDREAARVRMNRRRGSSDVRANSQRSSSEVRQPDTDTDTDTEHLQTDDDSKVAVIHHLSSSSFAEQVTTKAARLLLGRGLAEARNPGAWLASTARTMLTERADAILDAHARGMSVEIAAEYILTSAYREVDPPIRREIYVERAATYGRSVKAQQCAGENADMPEANREAFLAELDGAPGDAWYDAAVAAYDSYLPPKEATQ
jgi:hypothetical protein